METVLKIYFSINFFIAGYNYAEKVNWATKKSDKIQAYLLVAFSAFFGLAIIILTAVFVPIKKVWDYLNGYFQISFWFDFYLRKKYNNMAEALLKHINRVAAKRKTNSLKDRIYRRCVKLVNERNQYVYVPIRCEDDFGKHPNDFEHRCCFREQIAHIGEGNKYGIGEEVRVKMQSGKIAIYRLFAERYNHVFEDTGQKNWKYIFIRYE